MECNCLFRSQRKHREIETVKSVFSPLTPAHLQHLPPPLPPLRMSQFPPDLEPSQPAFPLGVFIQPSLSSLQDSFLQIRGILQEQ